MNWATGVWIFFVTGSLKITICLGAIEKRDTEPRVADIVSLAIYEVEMQDVVCISCVLKPGVSTESTRDFVAKTTGR